MRLTIGSFSLMTHLSVKTPRHYHRVGLLEPAVVDPATGYRYYSAAQVPTAQVIRRFRDLGMPIGQLRAVLAAPDVDERNRLIVDHLARMEDQLARPRSVVASLRALLTEPVTRISVVHRREPELSAVAVSDVVDSAGLGAWWSSAYTSLHGVGPVGGLYDSALFEEGRGRATMFVPVSSPVAGRTPFTVPAAELAVTVHVGPHDDIDRTYGALAPMSPSTSWPSPGRFANTTSCMSVTPMIRRDGGPNWRGPFFTPFDRRNHVARRTGRLPEGEAGSGRRRAGGHAGRRRGRS